jgi:hypothetical protein
MHAPGRISPGLQTVERQHSLSQPDVRFWATQSSLWIGYGVALMLPWVGTYTIASMVPNKVVVAGSGLLISSGLRTLYLAARRRGPGSGVLIAIVLTASAGAGFLWDGVLAAWVGSPAHDLRRLGALGSGIPQLAGGFYHALIMLSWSMAYVAISQFRSRSTQPVRVAALSESSPPAPAESPRRVLLRDGKRALVLNAAEIHRVEAAGDYVRVHTGPKRLLLRATMSAMESTLPATEFVRIHRSWIVRVALVHELRPLPNSEYEVILRDGTRLRASRTYAARLRAVLGML